ncbi:phytanoyl-CoA dioxygenase family protein [Shewanella surugensis]|uniref:Phytanoyl-CoA dioxygenase family protein n=1 Tax=Shewanella surugensis TaxID=212020 RepID=A0ABT0L707_9GAMM|nr:phytanoyl-CoA dioxygenase family protein [Shewanella surugensis]MCL1123479.1 phytanoyl-CoA dioxygenase family protein [Shewanella surugensis]
MLTRQQKAQYHQQGFVVLKDMVDSYWLTKIKAQAAQLVNEWQDEDRSHTFTTQDNNRSGNDFFFNSAENVCCFFEEEAFDNNGLFVQDRALCINKIGHALHELDPVFSAFSHQRQWGEIAKAIGLEQPQIRQSMYIYKQPNIGGEVNWHQDASFFYTSPQSVITYWFAIEDASLQNGCLWIEPRGHQGPLRERFNRQDHNTHMQRLSDVPWPIETGVPVEVKAGSLVVFHGFLPHYSAANRSTISRQAYTLHVTDGMSEYAKENWLQANKLPLRGFESTE